MAIVYLEAGQRFTFTGGELAVGPSGSSDDTVIDWAAAVAHASAPGTNEGVGHILAIGEGFKRNGRQQYSYRVYWERESKRFFYDDEEGY